MALPWPCAPSISLATREPPASAMSLTTSLAPSSAKRLAIASPKPEPPPVTTATLFLRRMLSSLIVVVSPRPPFRSRQACPRRHDRATLAGDGMRLLVGAIWYIETNLGREL